MGFVVKEPKEGYLIHEVNNEFFLCKIIKKYESEDEAIEGLLEVLNKPKNK